jgi:beta-galactosidase
MLPYPTPEDALTFDRTHTPWFMSLDGTWDFKLKPAPETVTTDDLQQGGWEAIHVPGNWTMQGFGKPHYTNVMMPFPCIPPEVPQENPTGIYRRTFALDAGWRGRRVVLHFGGSEGALYVYVNDQPVGLSKDARTPAEFDITPFVRYDGVNTVVAVVVKWSDASYIEDQDHWWQAGLHRTVFLYATGVPHLHDVFATPSVAEDLGQAILTVKCKIALPGEPADGSTLTLRLFDPDGKPVFDAPVEAVKRAWHPHGGSPALGRNEVEIERVIRAPRLWSAETPALYSLVVTLKTANGEESVSTCIGG